MRKIFATYGVAVVSVIVALSLFTFCFEVSFGNRQNLQQIFGIIMQSEMDKYTSQTELGTAFDEVGGHILPTIELINADAIVKGQKISLTQVLKAYDRNGASVSVSLKEVWKEDWTKDASVSRVNHSQLIFARAGVYWLLVSAEDAQGYQRENIVKIYVKEG